ncbi:hypothetical protein IHQ68_11680 [Chelatococcus sambhunathii]|uniref:Uncharacterized protein n=1 Tax=Chelatococcus sambhunathii TaxID=363953 RepID=A0ABU1DGN3_9HYPH|nr:hypothetical protein [Chelatococcus sambhunathii]
MILNSLDRPERCGGSLGAGQKNAPRTAARRRGEGRFCEARPQGGGLMAQAAREPMKFLIAAKKGDV